MPGSEVMRSRYLRPSRAIWNASRQPSHHPAVLSSAVVTTPKLRVASGSSGSDENGITTTEAANSAT